MTTTKNIAKMTLAELRTEWERVVGQPTKSKDVAGLREALTRRAEKTKTVAAKTAPKKSRAKRPPRAAKPVDVDPADISPPPGDAAALERLAPAIMRLPDAPDVEHLIEQSSLGTPAAEALRARTPDEVVEEIVRRSEEPGRFDDLDAETADVLEPGLASETSVVRGAFAESIPPTLDNTGPAVPGNPPAGEVA